ncbi:hypothetical protein DERP_010866 [Dermatophagoides pteronyssinus]|uniref:Uncharacterized protein n=1 Tax=Dermatophagoides pteronyssinus TaxID=6956 RepID=A0ABQ8JUN5_DERPT|nr:hypothetical protein DERP_010866 [Dermatophagoides pteronyssinus]
MMMFRKPILIWMMMIISILVINNNNNNKVDCGRSLPLGEKSKQKQQQQQQPAAGIDKEKYEEKLQTLLNAQKILQYSIEMSERENAILNQMLEVLNAEIRSRSSHLPKSISPSSSSSSGKIHDRKIIDEQPNSFRNKLSRNIKIYMKGKSLKDLRSESKTANNNPIDHNQQQQKQKQHYHHHHPEIVSKFKHMNLMANENKPSILTSSGSNNLQKLNRTKRV